MKKFRLGIEKSVIASKICGSLSGAFKTRRTARPLSRLPNSARYKHRRECHHLNLHIILLNTTRSYLTKLKFCISITKTSMNIKLSSFDASQSVCCWLTPDEIALVQEECHEFHYQIYSFRDLVGFESCPIMEDLFAQLSEIQHGAGGLLEAVFIRQRGDALGLQDAELQRASEYRTFDGIKSQLKELKTSFDTISKSGIDNPALKDSLQALTPEQHKAVQISIDALCLQNRDLKEDIHLANASISQKKNKSGSFTISRTVWNKAWWTPTRKLLRRIRKLRAYVKLGRNKGSNMPPTERHGRTKRLCWSVQIETSLRQSPDTERTL